MALDVSVKTKTSKNASSAIRRAQRKRLKDSAQVGSQIGQEAAPEDQGTMRQSRIDPEWRGDSMVWGWGQEYAVYQEFGTGPFTPPAEPLLDWAERVTGDRGFGWYVQQKIAEEGIEEKHFARDGRDRQIEWLKTNSLGDYLEKEL